MSAVVARDAYRAIRRNHGNVTVSVECERGEHPSTVRADARRFVRAELGPGWELCAWLGWEHYRRADGYPARARRWSVVFVGRS